MITQLVHTLGNNTTPFLAPAMNMFTKLTPKSRCNIELAHTDTNTGGKGNQSRHVSRSVTCCSLTSRVSVRSGATSGAVHLASHSAISQQEFTRRRCTSKFRIAILK